MIKKMFIKQMEKIKLRCLFGSSLNYIIAKERKRQTYFNWLEARSMEDMNPFRKLGDE